MKVEILIYAYLAICAAMIAFNIVCIFVFRKKERDIARRSIDFTKIVLQQLELDAVEEKHKDFLRKKLRKINHMMAFDETLEELYAQRPRDVQRYIEALSSVFVYLSFHYSQKDRIQAAYFPYIIDKYKVFAGNGIDVVTDSMMELVKEQDLYCRENALQALYTIGDTDSVVEALKTVNRNGNFHHTKMITDGLLSFTGDREDLDSALWRCYEDFSLNLKLAVLEYFCLGRDGHGEKLLPIMLDREERQELRLSAIGYFARHRYEPAFLQLCQMAGETALDWEYRAAVATALGNYPSEETKYQLKDMLHDENWYVRYNAAESLDRLGVRYEELVDIFEGPDRDAAEMLRYRFDRKQLTEKEGTPI